MGKVAEKVDIGELVGKEFEGFEDNSPLKPRKIALRFLYVKGKRFVGSLEHFSDDSDFMCAILGSKDWNNDSGFGFTQYVDQTMQVARFRYSGVVEVTEEGLVIKGNYKPEGFTMEGQKFELKEKK